MPADPATPARLVVAIDGPSGSGKSTVARAVGAALGLRYLDTGAIYRALTWAALDRHVDLADGPALAALARTSPPRAGTDPAAPTVTVDGTDLTAAVRTPAVTRAVSQVAAHPEVRAVLVAAQQAVIGAGGIVVEGRDIAAVVAPDAPVKVFLTASHEQRASRRHAQDTGAGGAGGAGDSAATRADLARRDAFDSGRAASPLRRADGAVEMDTTGMDADEATERVLALCRRVLAEPAPTGAPVAVLPPPAAAADSPSTVGGRRPVVLLGRAVGRLLRRALDVHVVGAENVPAHGPVLVAGNHTGFLDGPLVFSVMPRPAVFLTKAELFRGPLGAALDALGQIPVHRGQPDREALRRGRETLRAGWPLGIFPEGTRGAGELDSVHDGIAYVLLRSGVPAVPVVPVAVLGTAEMLPKGARWPRRTGQVSVVFGPPFTVSTPAHPRSRRAVATAAEEIRVRLVEHVAAARAAA